MKKEAWQKKKPSKPTLITDVYDRTGNVYQMELDEDTFNMRPDTVGVEIFWVGKETVIRGKKKPKEKVVSRLMSKKMLKSWLSLTPQNIEENAADVARVTETA